MTLEFDRLQRQPAAGKGDAGTVVDTALTPVVAEKVATPAFELQTGVHPARHDDGPRRVVEPTVPALTDISALTGRPCDELQDLFRGGRTPDPRMFSSEMRGLALEMPHHENTKLGSMVRWLFANAPPWKGKITKSAPQRGSEGTGSNRFLGRLMFPFEWNLVDSEMTGGFGRGKVLRLDYATPDSIANLITGIASVHDEIREIGPPGSGVYLGIAALKYHGPISAGLSNLALRLAGRKERVVEGGPPVPLCYFALQGTPLR